MRNKYQKLKKQYSTDGVNWYDVTPPEYKAGVMLEENSPDCGGTPIIYRWFVKEDEYVCEGYNKYEKLVYQQSDDNGITWEDVVPEQTATGNLIEANSIDCDYGITWEVVDGQYICNIPSPVQDIGFLKVLYNHNGNYEAIDVNLSNIANYPNGEYIPIGIVSPVLLPDGYYRVLSLVNACPSNPEKGALNNNTAQVKHYSTEGGMQNIFIDEGMCDEVISAYNNINLKVDYYYYSFPIAVNDIYGVGEIACDEYINIENPFNSAFPIDFDIDRSRYQKATCSCNNSLFYYNSSGGGDEQPCVSPFNNEYELNNIFIQEELFTVDNNDYFNVLSIYQGEEITNEMLNILPEEWMSISNLDNISIEFINLYWYALCRRYHNENYSGNWYLGTVTEMELFFTLTNKFNNTIALLSEHYPNIDMCELFPDTFYCCNFNHVYRNVTRRVHNGLFITIYAGDLNEPRRMNSLRLYQDDESFNNFVRPMTKIKL